MDRLKTPILLYDGHCQFCIGQAQNLKKIAGPRLLLESFQDAGVLARFPGVTREECMKEIKLALPDGRILGGAHAVFFSLSLNPALQFLRWIYILPVLKQIFDLGYKIVAAIRYQIQGRNCPDGTCNLHNPGGKHQH